MSANPPNPRALELLKFAETQQRHADALAQATGEHFNLFQILRVGHLEVTTHSPILAELLNPKGRHGQGAAFLRLFLARFEVRGFDAETATVNLEYHVGQITDTSGGRIDIMVKDSKGATILIENKIYAGDQDNQMMRYRAVDQHAELFYLTLYGRKPGNCGEVPNLRCVSYAEGILGWIKDCRKEAACVPTVREALSHYIHLIQELTQQNTSTLMNQEVIKAILQDKVSFLAYTVLCNAEQDIRAEILNTLLERLEVVASELGLQLERPTRELAHKDAGFYFSTPKLRANNLRIGFEFETGDCGNFFFGFKYVVEIPVAQARNCPIAQCIRTPFKNEFGKAEDTTVWWATWLRWNQYRHWSRPILAEIQFGAFMDDLKTQLKRLVEVAKQAILI